ncbi:MAG: S-layer homology domain-containing protein [Ruminococcaceae bacterium]|nr:S-layer homology domain-containing protein [Oscillospiraceae bacterium]
MKKVISVLLCVMLVLCVAPVSVFAVDNYDIYICGVRVTSDNAGDLSVIDGVDGTVSFDPSTVTLHLDNASIDGTSSSNYGNNVTVSVLSSVKTFTIEFSGDNTIGCEGNTNGLCNALGGLYTAFIFNGASSDAVLTINARTTPTGENGAARVGSVTVNSGTVYCIAPEERYMGNGYQNNPYGVTLNATSGNLLTVNGGKFICKGFAPVVAGPLEGRVSDETVIKGSVNYDGSQLEDYDYSANGFYDSQSHFQGNYRYVEASFRKAYSLYVGGVRVNSENCDDVFSDGTVSYDAETETLTLNNANIEAAGQKDNGFCMNGIYYGIWDDDNATQHTLNIKAIGENTVKGASTDSTYSTSGAAAYYSNWNLSFELVDGATLNLIGGNSETSQSGSFGINAESSTVSVGGNGTINAAAGRDGYRDYWMTTAGIRCKSLTVSGDVTLNATGGECVAASCGIILQNGGTLKLVDNATVNCKGGNILTDITLNPAAAGYAKKDLKASAPFYCSSGLGIYGNSSKHKITMDIKDWKGDFTAEGDNFAFSPVYRYDYNADSAVIEVFAVDDRTMDYVHFDSFSDLSSSKPDVSGYTQYPLDEGVCRGYKKCVLHPYRTFPDVPEGEWYYNYVKRCTLQGVIKGYANGNFGPADVLQRQDFVVMLARMFNADLETYAAKASTLKDITAGQYYTGAVNWAVENGIITGYVSGAKAGCFGVGDPITREQIAAILFRQACRTGFDGNVNNYYKELGVFADEGNISPYALDAMAWAVHNGFITGMNPTTLNPGGLAPRAQVATIFVRTYM